MKENLQSEKIKQHCRELRQESTDAEKFLWGKLRNQRFAEAKFRRQHSIGSFIADFYCHEAALVIELDGGQHAEPEKVLYNQERTQYLEAQGIRVLRFWNREVFSDTESVLEAIYNALTPALSQREREYELTKTTSFLESDNVLKSRTRKQISGFTLIEMTLAVLILTIITAVGIPSFRSLWVKSEMQQAAVHFVSSLRYAQQRAVMERYPISFFVDVDDNTFWVPVEQMEEKRVYKTRRGKRSKSRRRSSRHKRVRFTKEVQGKLPAGFIFEFVYKISTDNEVKRGDEPFTFYPDGSADAAYFTILRLADSKEKERRIFVKINPATGNIKMMEGNTEAEGSDFYRGYFDDQRLL